MAEIITAPDLQLFDPKIAADQAAALIADAMGLASIAAPCLAADEVSPEIGAAAKAILRVAILRMADDLRRAGNLTYQIGSLQVSPGGSASGEGMFTPDELADLAKLCGNTPAAGPKFSMPKSCPTVPDQEWARR